MQGKAKIAGKVSPVENSCCYALYNKSMVIQLDQVHTGKLTKMKQQEVETTYNPTVNKSGQMML